MTAREFVGEVVSDKPNKTVVVQVERRVSHPKYKKIIRRRAKFHAHDENNEFKQGDLVVLASVGAGFTVGSVLLRWGTV